MPSVTTKPTKQSEEKVIIVDEKSSKPDRPSKFSRKKTSDSTQSHDPNSFIIPKTEEEFCQQLLIGGFVQSFVDFYHLTHRVDPNAGEGTVASKIETNVDSMIFIRDNLVSAEICRRQGNTTGVYVAYQRLADFYATSADWRTSIFFHEKCLEVSQLTTDIRAEMSANHELGCVYQKMNIFEVARKYHEKHEEKAAAVDVMEEISKANAELYKVYMVLAVRADNSNNFDEALEIYHKCLNASKKSWDKAGEGEASGRIGNLLLNAGHAERSIPYLMQQSQITADMGFAEGRCRACSSLAFAYDTLNKPDKALSELALVHSISEQAGDMLLQAHACRSLGTLYSKLGKLQEAVDILQRHFSLLKSLFHKKAPSTSSNNNNNNNRTHEQSTPSSSAVAVPVPVTVKDLDMARLYVGISKGNLFMGSYIVAVQSDLSTLLDWKLNRTDLNKE